MKRKKCVRTSAPPARRRASSRSSRPGRAEADEIKTKIDLSHISKPGDALKAIISKQQGLRGRSCSAGGCSRRRSKPSLRPRPHRRPRTLRLRRPPSRSAAGCAPKFVVPTSTPRPTFTAPAPPAPPQLRSSSGSGGSDGAATGCRASVRQPRRSLRNASCRQRAAAAACASGQPPTMAADRLRRAAPAPPQAPLPRMIVPQTGPRPVYKAPLRPAPPARCCRRAGGATARPAPGRPVPGQPIFQRPRPGAPTESAATAAGRAPAHASDAAVAHRHASAGSRAGSCAFRGRRPGRAAGRARRRAGRDSAMFRVA